MRAMGRQSGDLGLEGAGFPMFAGHSLCAEQMPRYCLIAGTIPARVERAQCKLDAPSLLRRQGRRGSFVMQQLHAERLERIDPCRPMLVQRHQDAEGPVQVLGIQHEQRACCEAHIHQAVLRSDDGQIICIDVRRGGVAAGDRHSIPDRCRGD